MKKNILLAFLVLLLSACATSVTVRTNPSNAEISLLPDRNIKATSRLIANGQGILKGQQLKNELYRLSAPGYETIYVFFASPNSGTVLDFTVPKPLLSAEARMAQAENQVRSLTRILTETEAERDSLQKVFQAVCRDLVEAQRFINAQSFSEADTVLQRIFSYGADALPATAYTLRGKLRLLKGLRQEAIADFQQALRKSPEETEAKILLNTMEK